MAANPYDFSFSLRKEFHKKVLIIIYIALLIFVFMNLVLKFLMFPVRISSEAMKPEFPENSFVFIAPNYSSWKIPIFDKALERGSVVYVNPEVEEELPFYKRAVNFFVEFFTFQQYQAFKTENEISGNPSVRRVVGLPGDSVYMKDYVLYIKPAGEQHYLTEFELTPRMYETIELTKGKNLRNVGIPAQLDEIVLGDDEYFLLADDRTSSVDSRIYGPVSKDRIGGKAFLRYFPLSSFSTL